MKVIYQIDIFFNFYKQKNNMSLHQLNKDELIHLITIIEEEHQNEIKILEQKYNPENMTYYKLNQLQEKIIIEKSKRFPTQVYGAREAY